MALTAKQERFVAEYLIDLNATQAAIRAGYSEKTADQYGHQLLKKTSVAAAIAVDARNAVIDRRRHQCVAGPGVHRMFRAVEFYVGNRRHA